MSAITAPEMSDYERARLENIARNEAVLGSLGLLKAKAPAELMLSTPPLVRKRARDPDQHAAAERRCSPRLLELQAEEAASPRRSTRVGRDTRIASGQENDGFASPTASAARKEKRRHMGARAGRRGAAPELSNEELRALGERFGPTEWLVEMESFLRDHSKSHTFFNAQSEENVRSVMRQLHKLASGNGVAHPRASAPPFMDGDALTLEHNAGALVCAAHEWLDKWGRDLSNGWLLTHPLKKLQAFQQYLRDGHRNMAAHLE